MSALVNVGNNPAAIVSRSSRSAGSLAEMVGSPLFGEDYSLIPGLTDLIILTLPDDSLESAVEMIKKEWKYKPGTLVIHTSGIKESSILEPLRECGAKTAAIHPVASFPAKDILPIEGIHFAVEGKEKDMAMELVKSIGGIPFHIDAGKKALYHTACTFASGYLNILLESSLELMGEAGVEEARDVITALAKSSVEGWNDNGVGSLTGSIARGDVESVRSHLKSLENSEEELGIYRILALKTVTECEAKGILTHEKAEELKAALNAI